MDLRARVRGFLHLLQARALQVHLPPCSSSSSSSCIPLQVAEEEPVVLVTSHYGWMKELYLVLASLAAELGGERRGRKPRTPNTGVDKYTLTTRWASREASIQMLNQRC